MVRCGGQRFFKAEGSHRFADLPKPHAVLPVEAVCSRTTAKAKSDALFGIFLSVIARISCGLFHTDKENFVVKSTLFPDAEIEFREIHGRKNNEPGC